MPENKKLLDVKGLKKYFPFNNGILNRKVNNVKAVDNVDLFIKKGETFGLVGESGCGKTTAGRAILQLTKPTAGKIRFRSEILEGDDKDNMTDLSAISPKNLKALRREMQIIFQDPYSSLDPRMNIGRIVGEPLYAHGIAKGKEKDERVCELLESVGLKPEHMSRYPHEFSGGQRQRISIARALSSGPQLVVADEPVSALDVSVQAQVINLLLKLQSEFGLTYLFISHDLSVVKYLSDRVAVMYVGKIVELADAEELFGNPKHPYTEALMSAVPVPDPDFKTEHILLKGDVPSPVNPPEGCNFHPRCQYAKEICSEKVPMYRELENGHFVSCHFAETLNLQPAVTKSVPNKNRF